MTLVDRYLGAVRDGLPRAQRDDIIRELEDTLRSRIEDEEAARGRPLTEDEEADILRSYGHPLAVAARYRGDQRTVTFGRQLIGPELFPAYLKVLQVNIVVTVLVGAVIVLLGSGVVSTVAGIFLPILIQFIAVTILFIVIDRVWLQDPNGWDPRTVSSMGPDVDLTSLDGLASNVIGPNSPRQVRLTTSIVEFGLLAIAVTAWFVLCTPRPIGQLVPGPGWSDPFLAASVLLVVSAIVPLVTLFRPTWTRFRFAMRAFLDVAFAVVAGWSLSTGSWVVLANPATATADETKQVSTINGIVGLSLAVAIAILVLSAVLEARRFVQAGAAAPAGEGSGSAAPAR